MELRQRLRLARLRPELQAHLRLLLIAAHHLLLYLISVFPEVQLALLVPLVQQVQMRLWQLGLQLNDRQALLPDQSDTTQLKAVLRGITAVPG